MFSASRAAILRPSIPRPFATRILRPYASSAYLDSTLAHQPSVTTSPEDISPKLRHELESALRVDQAGELAANYIYKGQHDVLGRDPATGPLIQVCALPSSFLIF